MTKATDHGDHVTRKGLGRVEDLPRDTDRGEIKRQGLGRARSQPRYPPRCRIQHTNPVLPSLHVFGESPRLQETAAQTSSLSCLLHPACLDMEGSGTSLGLGYRTLKVQSSLLGEQYPR